MEQEKNKKSTLVVIGAPSLRSTFTAETVGSLLELQQAAFNFGINFLFQSIDYFDITVSRNLLLSHWYYHFKESPYLLFVDNDMAFPSALVLEMLALNADVVGTFYPKRAFNLEKFHTLSNVPYEKAIAQSTEFIGKGIEGPMKGNFCEAEYCGAGLMLISRKCIDIMKEKCPYIVDTVKFKQLPFKNMFQEFLTPFQTFSEGEKDFSEDFSFCLRWRKECQGKVYANIAYPVGHIGSFNFKSAYGHHLMMEKEEKNAG